ncbi:SDR family NAD(P)-dependent oxidoreductase [Nostoc sp. FACHB-133]|uniref:SDR family NAD(P)-dependent oxidoreductase n=1 Tax=Nostoc sp. FACHB-133 TaxID=2692835 RepID=UPI0016846F69|nr:SDR family NAD(P)-dependent oxidoreductase [Nostoc sp. FACHB-133]MBD2524695.1 SDR family NAD(P)-dependent oxidoreductase [Nostoc sp. FACHB-133]
MTNQTSSRVWLITGSSTGFGRALAEAALAQGDCVIATARDVSKIQDLEQQYPQTGKAVRLDVTDPATIQTAVRSGLAAFTRIDVLVNNAGYGLMGAIEEVSDQQIRDQLETNFFGLLNVTRTVIPTFKKQGVGHILNISSIGGRKTFPTMGLYHASKFAVEGLSETLAQELISFGIKVTIVEPGGFETDFSGRSLITAKQMPEYNSLRAELVKIAAEQARGHVPTGVQAMLKVVKLPDPPLHLVIGPNALPTIVQKLSSDIEEYQRFEHIWQDSTANAGVGFNFPSLTEQV